MAKRLATMCLMTVSLIAISSPPLRAQGDKYSDATLKGLTSVWVVVEDLSDAAKLLGLTADDIRTDAWVGRGRDAVEHAQPVRWQ